MSRIAFAISHSEHGGAQLIWADLAAAMARRGHETRMVALYPSQGRLAALPEGFEWAHCAQSSRYSPGALLIVLRQAARWMREWAPEVVYTALPAANAIFPLASLATHRRPLVFTSHHSPAFTYGRVSNRLDGLVGATPAVRRIICVSEAVRQALHGKARAYRAKATVIRNALPPALEDVTAALRCRRALGYQTGRRLIASGRLADQKNYPVLIRALMHVPGVSLEIIGVGEEEVALRTLAQDCGVANQVEFLGLMEREAALALIATRDVFVQPSLFEGHSLALIEAAQIGIAMIVSDVASQVEAVTRADGMRCALTHDPHDPLALAGAIRTLLGSAESLARGGALSASLGDEISFAGMVDAYEALIHEGRG